jgi:hypothetical protein
MKKLTVFLFFLLSSFLVKPVFAGNDITITCNNGSDCIKSSELPLFSETNIYPGFTQSQTFSVINNRNKPCQLTFKGNPTTESPSFLSKEIFINISGNDYQLSNYRLSDLLKSSEPSVSLGQVNGNSTNNYSWTVTLNRDADNNYQNKTTDFFNINFNFECDEDSPTPTPTSSSGSVLGSTSNSDSSSNQCNNSVPDSPTNLLATSNGDGSVTLTWNHSPSTHDGYLIAFGPSSGNYKYGAPNIGNVNSYKVQGLTLGAQYCFYVRSLNGCMPGGRTPEYCINPGSNITATNATPPGFQQNVLGATTESPTPNQSANNNVLGTENNCSNHWLPILFIAAFFINLGYIRYSQKFKITPFLISFFAFLIDQYVLKSRCCFGPVWFCHYFWIGNILSCLIPISLNSKIKKNTTK